MTPSGIEPATFRFVAQHLNHCATAVPANFRYYTRNGYKGLKKLKSPISMAGLATYNTVWFRSVCCAHLLPSPHTIYQHPTGTALDPQQCSKCQYKNVTLLFPPNFVIPNRNHSATGYIYSSSPTTFSFSSVKL